MVDPLDFHTAGLVLCTSSAVLARFLSSTPATLAPLCRPSELLLSDPPGPSSTPPSPSPQPPAARFLAGALSAARRSVIARTYRLRPASPLLPHVVVELQRGGAAVNGWRAPPVYVDGAEAAAEQRAAARGARGGGGGALSAGAPAPPPAPAATARAGAAAVPATAAATPKTAVPRSLWLTLTTTLPSRPLRQLLAKKGVAVGRLLRTGFGPFRMEKSLAAGSALGVAIPSRLMSAAIRFEQALKARGAAGASSGDGRRS
jgi:hypothetical protein